MAVETNLSTRIRRTATRLWSPRTETDRERRRIVALCLPFALLATVSGFVPLWEMVQMSVSEAQYVTRGLTFDAYATLLADPWYRTVAAVSVAFALATTVASLAVAVPVAHALEKYDLPFEDALVTVLSFPNSLPGIVAAFMILVLLGNSGLLTGLAAAVTGQQATDLAVATGVVGLFFAYLYSMVPRSLLLLRGSYAEVNVAAEEAARTLGATPWQTFRHVTLPQIRPGVTGAFVLTFRTALAIFGTVLILRALRVWTLQIETELANGYNVTTASAMATVWFAFVFGFTVLALRYTDAEVGL